MKDCIHIERKNTFATQLWYCIKAHPQEHYCFEGMFVDNRPCVHYECKPEHKFEISKDVFTMEE
jgi:hypothetical protein